MTENLYAHPEPVPAASQLAVLPFLAAVDGYLRESGDVEGLRITVHRTMSREDDRYLQQLCAYLNQKGGDWKGKVGRTFAVDTGIIGAAYRGRKIWHTKKFASAEGVRARTQDPNVRQAPRRRRSPSVPAAWHPSSLEQALSQTGGR